MGEAERRHLTVMFVDLVGSTEMATRMDAEDMPDVITGYQNTVAGVVSRYEGFVAKFMGDGVLVYFRVCVEIGSIQAAEGPRRPEV